MILALEEWRRRLRGLALALVVGGAIAAGNAQAQLGAVLETNDRISNFLNVRADPDSNSEVLGVVRPGDRVTQIGSAPRWYQIRLADGTEGWASKGYLRVAPILSPVSSGLDLSKLRIHFIDVGVGDAILIDYEDKEIFIDGGMGTNIAWQYVKDLIKDPIELVIVTHADTDHWKGLTRILGLEPSPKTPNFKAVEFWEPGYDRQCSSGSATQSYLNFIGGVSGKAQRVRRPLEATHTPLVNMPSATLSGTISIPELPGITFLLLHSNANPAGSDCAYRINNASIVVKLIVGNHSFLLTGDANGKQRDGPDTPSDVEAQLLQLEARLPGALRADVLKAPHHGSETASTSAFLAAVRPRFVVVSASTNHHLPRPSVVSRYNATGAIVLRTDQDRQSNNDHIMCYFEAGAELNCNYADLAQ